ncbi:SO_0444 family Cu/Zn efflux transporter [Acidobacteriota bacterium]
MSVLRDIAVETWHIFNDTAFFLLFGFFLAGILKVLVSPDRLRSYLGRRTFGAVLKASLIGVPLPLCSCSVLPTAVSLRKMGASRGATTSFLISTPETGVDSISMTYALMDPFMTIFRPLAALLTAVITGAAVNIFERNNKEMAVEPETKEAAELSCCSEGSCSSEPDAAPEEKTSGFWNRCLTYAFKDLFDDLVGWLILGFVLSGVIAALLPDNFFAVNLSSGRTSMLVMLLVGLPMYVCATASTPIAAAFLMKGLNPGAVVVFLLAGPASNIGSLFVLAKALGKKIVVIYLLGIASVSLICGELVNRFYLWKGSDPQTIVGSHHEFLPEFLNIGASVVLAALMIASAIRCGAVKTFLSTAKGIFGRSQG